MDTKRISTVSGAVLFAFTATASAGSMSFTSSNLIARPHTRTEPVFYRYYGGYGGWYPGAAIAGAALGLLTLGTVAATAGSPYYYGGGYGYPSYGWGYSNPYYGSSAYYGRPYSYGGSYAYSYPRYRNYGYYNRPRYRNYGYYVRHNLRQGRQYAYRGGVQTGRSIAYRHTYRGGHYR